MCWSNNNYDVTQSDEHRSRKGPSHDIAILRQHGAHWKMCSQRALNLIIGGSKDQEKQRTETIEREEKNVYIKIYI